MIVKLALKQDCEASREPTEPHEKLGGVIDIKPSLCYQCRNKNRNLGLDTHKNANYLDPAVKTPITLIPNQPVSQSCTVAESEKFWTIGFPVAHKNCSLLATAHDCIIIIIIIIIIMV